MAAREEKVTAFSKFKWKIISLILQPFLHRKKKKKRTFSERPDEITDFCEQALSLHREL